MAKAIEVPEGSFAEALLECLERVPIRRVHLRFDLWRKLCDEICAEDEWVWTFNGVPILAGKPVKQGETT